MVQTKRRAQPPGIDLLLCRLRRCQVAVRAQERHHLDNRRRQLEQKAAATATKAVVAPVQDIEQMFFAGNLMAGGGDKAPVVDEDTLFNPFSNNSSAEDPELAIHADLGRDQAEQVLKDYGLSDGVFLLRKKSDTKTVLTLCTHAAKASIKHHVLEVTAGGVTINKAALSQHCDTLQDAIALFRTGAPGEKHPDVRVKATVMVAPGAAPAPAKKAPYGPLDPKLAYAHKGRVDREKDIFGEDIRARDTAAATAGLEL